MNKITCIEMTNSLSKIKEKKRFFNRLISLKEVDIIAAIEAKNELSSMIESLNGVVSAPYIFIKELEKPETWEYIEGKYKEEADEGDWDQHHSSASSFFWRLERNFENLEGKPIDNLDDYRKFTDLLAKSSINKRLMVLDAKIIEKLKASDPDYFNSNPGEIDEYVKEKGSAFLYSAIHSIFLNKFLKPEAEITLDEPSKGLENFFGCYLRNGTFNLKKVGDNAGLRLNGATLNIGEAGDKLGSNMEAGVIRAEKAGNEAGSLAFGGTIRITEKVGTSFSEYVSGGTVILADRIKNLDGVIDKNPANQIDSFDGVMLIGDAGYNIEDPFVIRYSEQQKRRKYADTSNPGLEEPVVKNTGEYLSRFYSKSKKDKKFVIVDYESDENLSQGINGGIVVFRKAPKENIGLEMTNGAIILEDPNLTVEEAKNRLTKEKDGGIILMRVADPDNPGQTKLIDLEI